MLVHLMRNVSPWKRLLHRTVSNNANLVTVSFLCAESSKDCGADVERVYDESPGKMDEVWLACLMTGQKQATIGKLMHYIRRSLLKG